MMRRSSSCLTRSAIESRDKARAAVFAMPVAIIKNLQPNRLSIIYTSTTPKPAEHGIRVFAYVSWDADRIRSAPPVWDKDLARRGCAPGERAEDHRKAP